MKLTSILECYPCWIPTFQIGVLDPGFFCEKALWPWQWLFKMCAGSDRSASLSRGDAVQWTARTGVSNTMVQLPHLSCFSAGNGGPVGSEEMETGSLGIVEPNVPINHPVLFYRDL